VFRLVTDPLGIYRPIEDALKGLSYKSWRTVGVDSTRSHDPITNIRVNVK
jgi:hypothetical protein